MSAPPNKTATTAEPHRLQKELIRLLGEGAEGVVGLLESSLEGLWFWDVDYPEHVWISDSFRTPLGFTADDFRGNGWRNQVSEADFAAFQHALDDYLLAEESNPGAVFSSMLWFHDSAGEMILFSCQGRLLVAGKHRGRRLLLLWRRMEGPQTLEHRLNEVTAIVNDVPEPGSDTSSLAGKNVLIVDDLDLNIEMVASILTERGAEIRVARNGTEALSLLKKASDVDAILMDIYMPILDGFETTRRIRKGPAAIASIPIIGLTAMESTRDLRKARAVGMNQLISKPLDIDKVVYTLCHWCG